MSDVTKISLNNAVLQNSTVWFSASPVLPDGAKLFGVIVVDNATGKTVPPAYYTTFRSLDAGGMDVVNLDTDPDDTGYPYLYFEGVDDASLASVNIYVLYI